MNTFSIKMNVNTNHYPQKQAKQRYLIKGMRQMNLSMITNITINPNTCLLMIFLYDIEQPELIFPKGVGRTEERGQAGPQAKSKATAAQSEFFYFRKTINRAGEMGHEYSVNTGIYVE